MTLDFTKKLLELQIPKSAGMDMTEVNFELAPSRRVRELDEETFKEIMKHICYCANQPVNLISLDTEKEDSDEDDLYQ